mmetsp:Transcript_62275/g.131660  ORF Transcript_62275/g.131660 Transcript_62275/m.131660 type:complete len:280 (+) Transcript_62275:59-898(+)
MLGVFDSLVVPLLSTLQARFTTFRGEHLVLVLDLHDVVEGSFFGHLALHLVLASNLLKMLILLFLLLLPVPEARDLTDIGIRRAELLDFAALEVILAALLFRLGVAASALLLFVSQFFRQLRLLVSSRRYVLRLASLCEGLGARAHGFLGSKGLQKLLLAEHPEPRLLLLLKLAVAVCFARVLLFVGNGTFPSLHPPPQKRFIVKGLAALVCLLLLLPLVLSNVLQPLLFAQSAVPIFRRCQLVPNLFEPFELLSGCLTVQQQFVFRPCYLGQESCLFF